jgi:hypothetical protein
VKRITPADLSERLNAQELCRDYVQKLAATDKTAIVVEGTDEHGSLLMVFVANPKLAEQKCTARLAERLTQAIASVGRARRRRSEPIKPPAAVERAEPVQAEPTPAAVEDVVSNEQSDG